MENKILELEKKLQDMELKYNNLFEIVEELNYYFLKSISEGRHDGYEYVPIFIPRDNSRYLKSGVRYRNPYAGRHFITSGLEEDDIKEGLEYTSPSDIIKGVKDEDLGCVAPKHLWSIYDKVEKLKEQEKKELVEERMKKCVDVLKKIQSKKEDIEKRKEELKEKIREREVETVHMKRELDKYEEEEED